MILIGQYDSPFVRRVGITLRHYRLPFEHRPWSVFGDSEKIRPINPLVRVPTLVLAEGDPLVDSHTIIDFLDGRVPVTERLAPQAEPGRRNVLRVASLAMGASEKAVSLFYEKRLHTLPSRTWVDRCTGQMTGALDLLETTCGWGGEGHWFGGDLSHADICVAVSLRFIREAHPDLSLSGRWPLLEAGAARLEATAIFRDISQPFVPPA